MQRMSLDRLYSQGRAIGNGRPYGRYEAEAAIKNGVKRFSLYRGCQPVGKVRMARKYLKAGEKAPEGATEKEGSRGGRYYDTKDIRDISSMVKNRRKRRRGSAGMLLDYLQLKGIKDRERKRTASRIQKELEDGQRDTKYAKLESLDELDIDFGPERKDYADDATFERVQRNASILSAATEWHHAKKTQPVFARQMKKSGTVKTLEGSGNYNAGDWIIQNVTGEKYPISNESFQKKYARADGSNKHGQKFKPKDAGAMMSFVPAGTKIATSWGEDMVAGDKGAYLAKSVKDKEKRYPEDVWLVQKDAYDATYTPVGAKRLSWVPDTNYKGKAGGKWVWTGEGKKKPAYQKNKPGIRGKKKSGDSDKSDARQTRLKSVQSELKDAQESFETAKAEYAEVRKQYKAGDKKMGKKLGELQGMLTESSGRIERLTVEQERLKTPLNKPKPRKSKKRKEAVVSQGKGSATAQAIQDEFKRSLEKLPSAGSNVDTSPTRADVQEGKLPKDKNPLVGNPAESHEMARRKKLRERVGEDSYWGNNEHQPYWRPGPNPTVDNIITRDKGGEQQVLLIKRGEGGVEAGKWALPGGFHDTKSKKGESWKRGKETSQQAALRELLEETNLDAKTLEERLSHVGQFGLKSASTGRDPRDNEESWSVSNAYMMDVTGLDTDKVKGLDDAAEAKWVDVSELSNMELAFDHAKILKKAGIKAQRRLPGREVTLTPDAENALEKMQNAVRGFDDDLQGVSPTTEKVVDYTVGILSNLSVKDQVKIAKAITDAKGIRSKESAQAAVRKRLTDARSEFTERHGGDLISEQLARANKRWAAKLRQSSNDREGTNLPIKVEDLGPITQGEKDAEKNEERLREMFRKALIKEGGRPTTFALKGVQKKLAKQGVKVSLMSLRRMAGPCPKGYKLHRTSTNKLKCRKKITTKDGYRYDYTEPKSRRKPKSSGKSAAKEGLKKLANSIRSMEGEKRKEAVKQFKKLRALAISTAAAAASRDDTTPENAWTPVTQQISQAIETLLTNTTMFMSVRSPFAVAKEAGGQLGFGGTPLGDGAVRMAVRMGQDKLSLYQGGRETATFERRGRAWMMACPDGYTDHKLTRGPRKGQTVCRSRD